MEFFPAACYNKLIAYDRAPVRRGRCGICIFLI